jgi:hypothetical protein
VLCNWTKILPSTHKIVYFSQRHGIKWSTRLDVAPIQQELEMNKHLSQASHEGGLDLIRTIVNRIGLKTRRQSEKIDLQLLIRHTRTIEDSSCICYITNVDVKDDTISQIHGLLFLRSAAAPRSSVHWQICGGTSPTRPSASV